jgi:hypothetical protein
MELYIRPSERSGTCFRYVGHCIKIGRPIGKSFKGNPVRLRVKPVDQVANWLAKRKESRVNPHVRSKKMEKSRLPRNPRGSLQVILFIYIITNHKARLGLTSYDLRSYASTTRHAGGMHHSSGNTKRKR